MNVLARGAGEGVGGGEGRGLHCCCMLKEVVVAQLAISFSLATLSFEARSRVRGKY